MMNWVILVSSFSQYSVMFICVCSIMTTSSNGFEAYFDVEMVLVIAVCIKKERFSLKVTDCDVADGCWVCNVMILSLSGS